MTSGREADVMKALLFSFRPEANPNPLAMALLFSCLPYH